MVLRIVRLGEPHRPDEGLCIGTMRRPSHDVPKEEFVNHDFYGMWMPLLSPTPGLVKQALIAQSVHGEKGRSTSVRRFRTEMRGGDAARLLDMLATLSHQANLSVKYCCEDGAYCHRSVLCALLKEREAKLAP